MLRIASLSPQPPPSVLDPEPCSPLCLLILSRVGNVSQLSSWLVMVCSWLLDPVGCRFVSCVFLRRMKDEEALKYIWSKFVYALARLIAGKWVDKHLCCLHMLLQVGWKHSHIFQLWIFFCNQHFHQIHWRWGGKKQRYDPHSSDFEVNWKQAEGCWHVTGSSEARKENVKREQS